ncbi:hypothetical protein FKM82_004574 [Ascaphus truei]
MSLWSYWNGSQRVNEDQINDGRRSVIQMFILGSMSLPRYCEISPAHCSASNPFAVGTLSSSILPQRYRRSPITRRFTSKASSGVDT